MADEANPIEGDIISRDTLAKMNKSELAALARITYGLNFEPTQMSKEEMVDMTMTAARKFKGNAEMRVVKKGDNTAVPPGYVKIKVAPGPHNPRNRPIPIGLNFRMATVPVNKEIIMHGKWLPCLEDAVQTKYFVGKDDDGDDTLAWNEQHSYPFTIIIDNR